VTFSPTNDEYWTDDNPSCGENLQPEQFGTIPDLSAIHFFNLWIFLILFFLPPMGRSDSWDSKAENAGPNRFLPQRKF
jgi:hypothetical protein